MPGRSPPTWPQQRPVWQTLLPIILIVKRSSSSCPVWARMASWLGLLAVLSALGAPVALLAQELVTGKLGGLCRAEPAPPGLAQTGTESPSNTGHCDLCSAPSLAMPPPTGLSSCAPADHQHARRLVRANPLALGPELPFSRGPPSSAEALWVS